MQYPRWRYEKRPESNVSRHALPLVEPPAIQFTFTPRQDVMATFGGATLGKLHTPYLTSLFLMLPKPCNVHYQETPTLRITIQLHPTMHASSTGDCLLSEEFYMLGPCLSVPVKPSTGQSPSLNSKRWRNPLMRCHDTKLEASDARLHNPCQQSSHLNEVENIMQDAGYVFARYICEQNL